MKIEITCGENETFAATVNVRSLDFDTGSKILFMRVVMDDDWLGQKLCCAVIADSVFLEPALGRIHFEHYKDAAAFCAWLIESDAQVCHGFRTMRG